MTHDLSMMPNNPVALRLAISALARLVHHDIAAAEVAGLDNCAELDTAIEVLEAMPKALNLDDMQFMVYCGHGLNSLLAMLDDPAQGAADQLERQPQPPFPLE